VIYSLNADEETTGRGKRKEKKGKYGREKEEKKCIRVCTVAQRVVLVTHVRSE